MTRGSAVTCFSHNTELQYYIISYFDYYDSWTSHEMKINLNCALCRKEKNIFVDGNYGIAHMITLWKQNQVGRHILNARNTPINSKHLKFHVCGVVKVYNNSFKWYMQNHINNNRRSTKLGKKLFYPHSVHEEKSVKQTTIQIAL